jgi:ribosomal protein L24E
MHILVRRNPEICEWLDTYHSLLWYRSGFNPAIKYDYVTKNMVESFNNWIEGINDLSVCELVNKLREKIMKLYISPYALEWPDVQRKNHVAYLTGTKIKN